MASATFLDTHNPKLKFAPANCVVLYLLFTLRLTEISLFLTEIKQLHNAHYGNHSRTKGEESRSQCNITYIRSKSVSKNMSKNQLKHCQIVKISVLLQEIDVTENDADNRFWK